MSDFKKGDRVRMRLTGANLPGPRTGVVIGMSRSGAFVRVRRDGRKGIGAYAPEFWERDKRQTQYCYACGRALPKRIVTDAASAAKEAVPSVHEPIPRKAQ